MSFYNPVGGTEAVTSMFLASHGIFPNPGAKVFFLNNSTSTGADGAISGSNGNSGLSPKEPLSTIAGAIAKCKAGRGDVIVVMPGHAETLTAVTTLSVAGVQVIGCKIGNKRPVFTINGAVDLFSITAANVMLASLECNIVKTDAATAFVNVAAGGAYLKDLYMIPSSGTENVVDVITLASGANECVIEKCVIFNTTVAVNSFVSIEAAVARVQILDNFFFGDVATAGIIDAAAATHLRLEGNTIGVIGATKPAATLDSNPTGVADNNRFLGTDTTIANNNAIGNLMRQARSFVLETTDNSVQATNIIPALDTE